MSHPGCRVPHFSRALCARSGPFQPSLKSRYSRKFYTISSIGAAPLCLASYPSGMSSEDYIKDLCARAIAAEGDEFVAVTKELHAALKAHIESLRSLVAASLLPPPTPPNIPPEA